MKRLRQLLDRLLNAPGTRRILAGTALATLVLVSAVAQAAGGGGHHGDGHVNFWTWDQHAPPVGWFIVNAVIFVALLVQIAKKPMRALFQKRHDAIKQQIQENKDALAKARAHHDEYTKKLERVAEEVQSLVINAEKDGQFDASRIVEAARAYAERLRKDAGTALDQESRLAYARLYAETVNRSLERAEKILRTTLTDADRKRLVEQSIDDLENGAAQSTSRTSRSESASGGAT